MEEVLEKKEVVGKNIEVKDDNLAAREDLVGKSLSHEELQQLAETRFVAQKKAEQIPADKIPADKKEKFGFFKKVFAKLGGGSVELLGEEKQIEKLKLELEEDITRLNGTGASSGGLGSFGSPVISNESITKYGLNKSDVDDLKSKIKKQRNLDVGPEKRQIRDDINTLKASISRQMRKAIDTQINQLQGK